jgi:hypothetical protein
MGWYTESRWATWMAIRAFRSAYTSSSHRVLERADFGLGGVLRLHTLFPNPGDAGPQDVCYYGGAE